jgi:hypothetical protein
MTDALRALVAKWRARKAVIDSHHATMGIGWEVCADELEALLELESRLVEGSGNPSPDEDWQGTDTIRWKTVAISPEQQRLITAALRLGPTLRKG